MPPKKAIVKKPVVKKDKPVVEVKETEREICGVKISKIRKSYFEKQLEDLINGIQASGSVTEEEVGELGLYLESLRTENMSVVERVLSVFGGSIISGGENGNPPSVEELRAGLNDDEWREKADKAYNYIEETLTTIRTTISDKKAFNSSFWSDQSVVFLSMQGVIDKDLIYKEQQYRARLTEIIDKHGMSRAQAEERAKLTAEYFKWQDVTKLAKRIEEFYTFARRKDDETNHR